MTVFGHNGGFHVLEEFVCDAIHAPSVPLADPANQERNEGMSVIDELLFEVKKEPNDPASNKSTGSATLDDALESELGRLTAIISTSTDPVGTVALIQKRLLAVVAGISKSATV